MTVGELLHLLESRDRSMEVTVQTMFNGHISLKPVLDGVVMHQLVGSTTFVLDTVPEFKKASVLLITPEKKP